jgi:hypothetical protein
VRFPRVQITLVVAETEFSAKQTMLRAIGVFLSAAVLACSGSDPSQAHETRGHVVVAVTIDWEGAYVTPDGLDALDAVRDEIPGAPITHFVSAGYFTKQPADPAGIDSLRRAVRPGDELAVHLHGWRSLATKAGIEPRLSPSFLSGTDALLDLGDSDAGFDVDLDAYTSTELRILLRTSRQLLATLGSPISKSFRAGGYLGTPRVLQAIRDEGFVVDSSATDAGPLPEGVFRTRVAEIWPDVAASAQPSRIPLRGGHLVELPIAAIADYMQADKILKLLEDAAARLAHAPQVDVFVVLAFHHETGADFGPELSDALKTARARADLSQQLVFVTIEDMARRSHLDAPARK